MARDVGITVENSFVRGLITEATGLNYPENACIETENCIFDQTGEVYRRPGVEFEDSHQIFATALDDVAITEYVWRGASQNGELTFFVVQVGNVISFFRADVEGSVSPNHESFGVLIDLYKAPGAPETEGIPCSFAAGNGYLFVTHPYCNPIFIEYHELTRTITTTQIDIKIRDLHGLPSVYADGTPIDVQARVPLSAAPASHIYNLLNQGWYPMAVCTPNNIPYATHQVMAWFKFQTGELLPAMSEMWWVYKAPLIPRLDGDGNVISGTPKEGLSTMEFGTQKPTNTPAPKGHYILDAFYEDRTTTVTNTYTGDYGWPGYITDLDVVSSGYQRPSQCAFFAGRAFYAGVAATDYNTKIYFSQILDGKVGVDKCYQMLDPTAEEGGDLLPTDGGVIVIPEVAKIVKLVTAGTSVLVFATNGVWAISGSEGIGFTAVDYNVTRLSSIGALGAQSFVDVDGTPMWWNLDGIYTLKAGGPGGTPTVESVTNSTIRDFYQAIPAKSKQYAKGAFNTFTRIVQWIYRDEEETGITDRYEYDRVLNLDISTAAFYPWTLPDVCVKLSGITVLLGQGLTYTPEDVEVGGVDVTVNSLVVTANAITRSELTNVFKYLTTDTCEVEEIDDAVVTDVVSFDSVFKGHATNTSIGTPTRTIGINGPLIGADGKFYSYASGGVSGAAVNLVRHDGVNEDVEVLLSTTLKADLTAETGIGPSTWADITRFVVPVPFTKYFYVALGGVVGAVYYSIWGLYQINASGNIEFVAAQAYQGGAFQLNYVNAIHVHGVDFLGAPSDAPEGKTLLIALTGLSTIVSGGSSCSVFQVPSVTAFIAATGTDNGAGSWSALANPNFAQSYTYLYHLASYQADDVGNIATAFFLPVNTGSAWTSMICQYVPASIAQYHVDFPSHGGANATIAAYAATYPTGFILGTRLDTGAWSVLNANFKTEAGGTLVPFADLGDERDGSAGDPYYNDWATPTVQHNAGTDVSYVIWTRKYDNTSANQSPTGHYAKVMMHRWNPSTELGTFLGENEGSAYDTVSTGIATSELSRYGQYPVTTFTWLDGSNDLYIFVYSDSTHGTTGMEYILSKFGTFTEPTVTLAEAGLTFAEFNNLNYLDWEAATGGEDFTSFFVPGYKIRGEAIRKFQSTYVRLFTDNTVPSTFDFSSRWDFSNSSTTGRWSQTQRIEMDDTAYDFRTKRLKIRGHGLALTFKVTSVTSQPFNIIGWSMLESANKLP